MEKTIVIHMGEKDIEIPVKASMAALSLYRTEFNADLIRDLNEVNQKLHPDPFADAMKRANVNPNNMTNEELTETLLKNVDYSILSDQDILPDYDSCLKVMQIFWVMAKAADNTIEKFDKWLEQFDFPPVKALSEQIQRIWTEANMTTIEIKN